MKKHLLLTITLMATFAGVFANPVNDSTAKAVGLNFLAFKVHSKNLGIISNLKLAYTAFDNSVTCFYVFNVDSTKGFVIVSADDNTKPILGYSDESNFDSTQIPIQLSEWLEGYTKQISAIIQNKLIANNDIKNKWQELKIPATKNKYQLFGNTTFGSPVISPLIQTKWDQDPIYNGSSGQYNALCPYDSINNARTITGCGATAMAQVMKFWNYPQKGYGFNSYTPKTNPYLGLQSVNFGNTTYQWSSMPLQLTSSSNSSQINSIATLMFHCGVSINMDYGVNESNSNVTGGKRYHPIDDALKTYFGYDTTLTSLWRSNYSDANWINIIENELNLKRPVLYRGSGTGGGHIFIADGYDNNNYLHFNWGWSGTSNGYFEIDSLNPGSLGAGGGTGGYNSGQIAIIGIKPSTNVVVNDIRLYTNVTPADTTIYYGDSLFINTNIVNRSTTTFSGDYCAALFDTASKFVDYVQILSNKTLKPNSHYTNGLTFSTTGRFNFIPGKYTIQIWYRPTGGNWLPVSDTLGYVNQAKLTILGDIFDSLELYAPLKTTPKILTQGLPDTISFNVVNRASKTFTGEFAAALYNLDGTFAQLIGTHIATSGLKTGYHYTNGITFYTSSINVQAGTYLLLIEDSVTNGYWRLTGSGKYTNPILVSVQPPALAPDVYEPNDYISQSYLLPLTFTNNLGYTNTIGSNINVGSDNDFYKIKLPKGYNYKINPILNSQSYSSNSNIYSLNGIFSMSYDSINWTGTYQDTLPLPINAKGGQTIFFHVAPYFQGLTGTYLLEINLTRAAVTPVQLEYFSAREKNQDVLLNWQTATELNTSHFNVQHSTNGTSFTNIGNVKAIGSGANGYSFTDSNPTDGINYYRLQSIDKDGSFSYSKVISASLTTHNSSFISIFPNPARDFTTIIFSQMVDKATIAVYDITGKAIITQSLNGSTNSYKLNTQTLTNGVYVIKVNTATGSYNEKLLINK